MSVTNAHWSPQNPPPKPKKTRYRVRTIRARLVNGGVGSRGQAWGYRVQDLARVAGVAVQTVWRAIHAGTLDPADLRSVAGWIQGRIRG